MYCTKSGNLQVVIVLVLPNLLCAVAGVEGGRLVEAHGSFSTASCTRCHSKQDPQDVKVHTATNALHFRQANTRVAGARIVKFQLHVCACMCI